MNTELKTVKRLIIFFMIMLFISGATAIPIDTELTWLLKFVGPGTSIHEWLNKVLLAYKDVKYHYPFLLYGYDWLAFAHFILAVLFIGPLRDPVKNIWVIEFGMIACVLVLPLAFIDGPLRGIPAGWMLIDCSFGIIGLVPLLICYRKIKSIINKQVITY
jgi:hypothetical protein